MELFLIQKIPCLINKMFLTNLKNELNLVNGTTLDKFIFNDLILSIFVLNNKVNFKSNRCTKGFLKLHWDFP